MKAKKTVLVVGGNRGIGYFLSVIYLSMGYEVLSISRRINKRLPSDIQQIQCDICNHTQTLRVINYHLPKKIDILIMSAGGIRHTAAEEMKLNYVVTKNFIEKLLQHNFKIKTINLISSLSVCFIKANNSCGRFKEGGYANAKHSLEQWGLKDLIPNNPEIKVSIFRLGFVWTKLIKKIPNVFFPVKAEKAAQAIITCNEKGKTGLIQPFILHKILASLSWVPNPIIFFVDGWLVKLTPKRKR